ncbi:uncharacterized protein LOC121719489 [Alosa sapidissima]|uniref:uncharacterized protein LOC121719489 n=1 Tax=Alosa sapidissima TaxID=34773 RepID=UPI001C0935D9|nr:uncharacterized protein LOC121719489 [Alosa sapidissima]
MRTCLIISLSLITVIAEMSFGQPKPEPITLKAFAGGAVLVACSSAARGGSRDMFFCRDGGQQNCITDKITPVSGSRLSLCNAEKGPPKVLMTQLRVSDSAVYQCGVKTHQNTYRNTTFRLEVTEDPLYGKSVDINGQMGENVTIRCQYPDKNKNTFKYLYRQPNVSHCAKLVSSEDASEDSRYEMFDDKERGIFTVTFRRLTLEDAAGMYWCGVGTGKSTGSRSLITQVKLHVIDPAHQRENVTTACTTSCLREQTPAETSTQPETLTSRNRVAPDWTVSIIIISLVGFLTGLAALLLFIFWRRRTTQTRPISSPNGQPNGRRGDTGADRVYEEIRDTSHPKPAATSSSSSSAEGVYALAQLPSPEGVYALTQLPSEGCGYSTVSFNRHSSSPDHTRGTVTTRAVNTEYATIQCHT